MRNINILSLVQAYKSLNQGSYADFLRYYEIAIKNKEVEDLTRLIESLENIKSDICIFDGFYVGYKIPQIGKEFDFLRFGDDYIINLEVKSVSTEEKIKKQLKRNKYYLSYLGKKIYSFSFVSASNELFIFREDKLEIFDFLCFEELLKSQYLINLESIDDLFNPSDYLVSPFNAAQNFINDKYFLTHQQEDIKNQIIKSVGSREKAKFISIVGGAGTGKTLLVYDIVKKLMFNANKCLIFHCGYLNDGQEELKNIGWEIAPIKKYKNYDLSDYDVVVIDEAQRIYPGQLEKIIENIYLINGGCIFSYDKVQTLASWEEKEDINSKIKSINNISTYKLSEKIRTNKEISTFIKMLFNIKRNLSLLSKNNIELNYFKDMEDAKNSLLSLDDREWEVLRFTPSQYDNEYHEKYSDLSCKNSHKVIGQEFDNVVVTIDKHFTYNKSGELVYRGGAYYQPVKMLFQNITRARKRLKIVIIDNEELLNRCVSIFK